jgi:hypothetical protein
MPGVQSGLDSHSERLVTTPGSVTHWIQELRAGDPIAAQKLWERYFRRLVGLARQKL